MRLIEWLNPLVEWVWENKERILKEDADNLPIAGDHYGFHIYYPYYGGMPDNISCHLSDKHLDILNKHIVFFLQSYPSKEQFCQKLCDVLTNSTVIF